MKRDYKKEREGQVLENKQGYKFKIIEYVNAGKVLIKFLDKHEYCYWVTYSQCKDGKVFNPYHPTISGVGYLGDGKYRASIGKGKMSREYKVWENMLNRVYKDYTNYKTYKDGQVCERWHNFQNFCEDLPLIEGYDYWLNHPNERISLDKDIKGNGSKMYNLENCCFITISENSHERLERLPQKTLRIKGKNIYSLQEIVLQSLKELPDGFHESLISKGITKNGFAMCNSYFWMKQEKFDYTLFNKIREEKDKRVMVTCLANGKTTIYKCPQDVVKTKLISRTTLDKILKNKKDKVVNGYTYKFLKDVSTKEVEEYIKQNIDSTVQFLHDIHNEEYLLSM